MNYERLQGRVWILDNSALTDLCLDWGQASFPISSCWTEPQSTHKQENKITMVIFSDKKGYTSGDFKA